ncbi:MAG: putative Se/S carrier-like protein [Longimicrobiales bacterium]
MNPVLVFDTTHHALWAEQVALGSGCAAEIQPAPAAARAKCALALAYLPGDEVQLLDALRGAGVPYRKHTFN